MCGAKWRDPVVIIRTAPPQPVTIIKEGKSITVRSPTPPHSGDPLRYTLFPAIWEDIYSICI